MTPVFMSTRRTAWFVMSTMKRLPALSKRISCGWLNVACSAGPPSPRVALLAAAGDGVDLSVRRDLAHALAGVFAEPERAIRSAHDAEGIVDLRGGRGAAVAGEAFHAGAGDGADFGGGKRGSEEEQGEENSHGAEVSRCRRSGQVRNETLRIGERKEGSRGFGVGCLTCFSGGQQPGDGAV